MDNSSRVTLVLTASQVALLAEALDSHEYWQLSDPSWRNSGYVILPGDDVPPTPSLGDDAAQQAIDAIREARALQDLLRASVR